MPHRHSHQKLVEPDDAKVLIESQGTCVRLVGCIRKKTVTCVELAYRGVMQSQQNLLLGDLEQ
jgi:GTP cyclohydrolase I